MEGQRSGIEWRGGVPVSRRFDDPYYALEDGLAETRHVFLAGNGLPGRFRDGFHVAELGFGTGLNLLAAWKAFRAGGVAGRLRFTSFEAYPLGRDDMAAAHRAFPELRGLSAELLDGWTGAGGRYADLDLAVIGGEAGATVPGWTGRADAWFLDGFAPARNPGLWTPELLAEVARHTAPVGTVATYSAAGHVRRALAAAGFDVTRARGYGRKRHMTKGRLA